VIWCDLVGM